MTDTQLLIDISNSQTKIAVCDGGTIGDRRCIATPQLTADGLVALAGEARAGRAVLASVVPEKSEVVREAFDSRGLLEVRHDIHLGVAVHYPEPETIGADRLANAAAFFALYGKSGVVVDFGTAVTFDIIAEGGKYVGGVIAPGLEVMTDYMFQRTALLPKIDLFEPEEVIGKSTRSAMLAGAVIGYRGLVKEILTEIEGAIVAMDGDSAGFRTVATGGYATLIAANVPGIGVVDENLTLEGLRIIARLNP